MQPCAGLIDQSGTLGIPPDHPNPGSCVRHNEGNLMVYADGHAKWHKWNQMTGVKVNPTRATP